MSPRATPSRSRKAAQDRTGSTAGTDLTTTAAANGMTTSTAQQDDPKTPVKNYGTTQDVSPSVDSQDSRPRTPPSAGTVRYIGRQDGGEEAGGVAKAEQASEEPSMDEIRKFMGDEEGKK